MSSPAAPALPPRRRGARATRGSFSSVLLRELPGSSPLKSAWAGTKLICLLLITAETLYLATWWAVGAGAVLLALGILAGRVPASAWPRIPTVLWFMVVGGGVGSWLGGGLRFYLLTTALSVIVLGTSLVATWTTPMPQIAPAVATLLRPLRLFRLPVDEWALAVGLTVRSIPPLVDELAVVFDAARLRPRRQAAPGVVAQLRLGARDLGDAVVTVLATSARRGADTGTAMVARGGPSPLPRERVRLCSVDIGMLVVTVLVLAVPALEAWTPLL